MSRNAFIVMVMIAAVAAACSVATGMGARFGAGPMSHSDGWPDGLLDLCNSKSRVDGYWVNANTWCHFAGDAKAFNAFLNRYASLTPTPLRLILHPGPRRSNDGWTADKIVPSNWMLSILRRGWGAPEAKPGETGTYVVTLHLWLGGTIALQDLDVPLNVSVRSGTEIEKFVAEHEARQSLVPKEGGAEKPPAATPPGKPQ